MQHFSDLDISTIKKQINKIASLFKTNVLSNGQYTILKMLGEN